MSGGTETTTSTSLPDALRPIANAYNSQAMGLSNTQFQPYTAQRFAGQNADQQTAYDLLRQQATGQSPVMSTANSALTNIMQGGNTNPYLDQMVGKAQQNIADQYTNIIRPQQNARMAASGSYGNSGVDASINNDQTMLMRNMGDVAGQMYGNAYNTDRANQLSALGMAPTFANQSYAGAGQLLAAGNQQQANAQQGQDFAYQQWQDANLQPYKNLQTLGSPLAINQGGTSTTVANGK